MGNEIEVCDGINPDEIADADAFDKAHARIDALESQLSKAAPLPPLPIQRGISDADFVSHFDQAGFESAVERIKEYIVAGDVMQVVISQRMSVEFGGDPLNVYRALRYLNPSPYMVFFDLGDHHVVSASPEILARVEQGKIAHSFERRCHGHWVQNQQ